MASNADGFGKLYCKRERGVEMAATSATSVTSASVSQNVIHPMGPMLISVDLHHT